LPPQQEEVISNEKVEITENDSDWLHDIPGKVEIDEVMQDGDLREYESRKDLDSSLCFIFQFLLDDLDVLFEGSQFRLYHLEQLFVTQFIDFYVVACIDHVFHHMVVQSTSIDRIYTL